MSDSDATTRPPSPITKRQAESNNVHISSTNINVTVNPIDQDPSKEDNNHQFDSFHKNPSPHTNKRKEKLPSIRSLLPYLEYIFNDNTLNYSISPDNPLIVSSDIIQHHKIRDKSSQPWIYPQNNLHVVNDIIPFKTSLPPITALFTSINKCNDPTMPFNKLLEIFETRKEENQGNHLKLITDHQHTIPTPRTRLYLCLPIRKPRRGRNNTYLGRLQNSIKDTQTYKTNPKERLCRLEEIEQQLAFVQNLFLLQSSFCGQNRKRNANTLSSFNVVHQRLNPLVSIPVKSQQLCKSVYLCNVGRLLTEAFDKNKLKSFEMMSKQGNLLSPFRNHPLVNMSWNGYEFLKSQIQQSTSCNKFTIDSFSTVCQGIQLQFVKCLKRDRHNKLLIQLIEQISIQIRLLYDTVIYEETVSLEWGSIISNSLTAPLLMLVDSTTTESCRNGLRDVVISELQKVMRRMLEMSCPQRKRSNEDMNDMMMVDQICGFVEIHACLVQFFSEEEFKKIEQDCNSNGTLGICHFHTLLNTRMFVNEGFRFLNE